ncbi:hypothetical protein ACJMQP_21465 [Rhodopseudomonas palustris]
MKSWACLSVLGIASASTTLLILGVSPSWIAFANIGIGLAATGISARPKWTGTAMTEARPWFPRRDRSRENRRAAFISIAAPLLPRRTIQRFEQVARQSDRVHRRRAEAEVRLRDFHDRITAASIKTSPAVRKLRDHIAVLSIEAVMADEAVQMLAREMRKYPEPVAGWYDHRPRQAPIRRPLDRYLARRLGVPQTRRFPHHRPSQRQRRDDLLAASTRLARRHG